MASVTRRTARTFGVGLVTLAAFGFLFYLALGAQLSSTLPWQATTRVEAEFDDVATLAPGDDVRENGVRIGRVGDIHRDGKTIVVLQLDGDVPVYADTRAMISDRSALAARYVELHRGHPNTGNLGSKRIPPARTTSATDLGDLLDVFDPATRGQLQKAVGELGRGAAGHSQDLHDVLENAPQLLSGVSRVSSTLSGPGADIGSTIRNVDALASQFQGREADITGLVGGLDKTLRAVNADNGTPLTDTLDKLPSTLGTVRESLAELDTPLADTRAATTAMRPGTGALGRSVPDLRGFLRESPQPLGKVPDVVDTAVPAVNDLTHTVADVRPLAPKLSEGITNLAPLLEVVAPYASDLVTLAQRGRSFTSSTVNGEHVARIGLNVTPGSLLGGIKDPTFQRNVYPGPGEAANNDADSLLRPRGEGQGQ